MKLMIVNAVPASLALITINTHQHPVFFFDCCLGSLPFSKTAISMASNWPSLSMSVGVITHRNVDFI